MNFNEKQILRIFLVFLVIVSVLPELASSYLVHKTGSIKIIGLGFGLLIAALIYYKWKYVKQLFYLIFIVSILADIFILSNTKENQIAIIILLLLHLGVILFFTFSKNIKTYLSTPR